MPTQPSALPPHLTQFAPKKEPFFKINYSIYGDVLRIAKAMLQTKYTLLYKTRKSTWPSILQICLKLTSNAYYINSQ